MLITKAGTAGMALGMVMQLPDQDDETSVSRRQLLAKLDVCMGGRVAEELIFGESNITTGMQAPIIMPALPVIGISTYCSIYTKQLQLQSPSLMVLDSVHICDRCLRQQFCLARMCWFTVPPV